MIGLIRKHISVNILVIFFLLFVSENVKAQKIEITPIFGYFTSSNLPRDQNYLRIRGGIEYGISLSHTISRTWRLEFSFSSLKSDLSLVSAHAYREIFSDLKSKFFSVGAMKEFNPGEKLSSYILPAFGFIYYHPLDRYSSNESLLDFSLAGGVKYSVTDVVGLRFQARLLMPVWFRGDYFTGDYSEILASFKTTKVSFQGDFTIGVILKIQKKS
jgi:hypothetical protein